MAEMLKNLIKEIIQPDFVFVIAGIIIFGTWLLRTSLGQKALLNSRNRRNNLPLYLPFAAIFLFFFLTYAASNIIKRFLPELEEWQNALLFNTVSIILGVATIILIMIAARAFFARRLKGFGLNPRKAPGDFGAAILNLLAVWPLLTAAFIVTTGLGKYLSGPDYQMPTHDELKFLTQYPQTTLVFSVIVLSVVIAPILEEFIFRGFFQSLLRSITGKPWMSILIISILFAITH
jgi:membrane protease YdiL (CAAX protease family)